MLVATILSAQCTDVRVNIVTPALFAKYPDAEAFARADIGELEKAIQSTGFFRNKARNIQACCKELVDKHGGQVPGTMEELVPLPGIGRKTANVILGNAFDVPGITVDTHVTRLSQRMGLTVQRRRGEDRTGPDGADPAKGLDDVQPSHDLSWPAGLPGPQTEVRHLCPGGGLSEGRRGQEELNHRGTEDTENDKAGISLCPLCLCGSTLPNNCASAALGEKTEFMHVVIVDGDVSYPATSGKRLRTLNLMLKTAKRQRITYVGRCAADSEEARVAPDYLRSHGIESILVHHAVPHKSGPGFYARLLANLLSSWPYSVTSHQSEPMRQALSDLAKRDKVDVWQLEWTGYLPMVEQVAVRGPRRHRPQCRYAYLATLLRN